MFFLFDCIPDQYKTQEISNLVVSLYPFLIVYCPDKSIIQKVCDKDVDDSLAALKLIPEQLVATKLIKNLYTTLYVYKNILCFNEDFGDAGFPCNGMGILSIDLNNINFDKNFDEDDSGNIILIKLLAWKIKFEKRKALKGKVGEKLIPIAWNPKIQQNFCMSEDNKKEMQPIFTELCF